MIIKEFGSINRKYSCGIVGESVDNSKKKWYINIRPLEYEGNITGIWELNSRACEYRLIRNG